jgi:hypothetical protein
VAETRGTVLVLVGDPATGARARAAAERLGYRVVASETVVEATHHLADPGLAAVVLDLDPASMELERFVARIGLCPRPQATAILLVAENENDTSPVWVDPQTTRVVQRREIPDAVQLALRRP